MKDYQRFLETKKVTTPATGFQGDFELNPALFPFQRDIVRWALRRGRACVFAGCGLGKTPVQLEWARITSDRAKGNVIILAPLAVSQQTVREGQKFGVEVHLCRSQADVRPGVNITNYEMLHKFDLESFVGVVADESSILKCYSSKTRKAITEGFKNTRYKLACTATPAPNDFIELGTHSEFVGAMTRTEMMSMFFWHDGKLRLAVDGQEWRLKRHAEKDFWEWMCSWAVMLNKPSDLGYNANGFDLPKLTIEEHIVKSKVIPEGMLLALPAETLSEQRAAKRATLDERVQVVADLVNASDEPWLIWCELNDEGNKLTKAIDGAVQIAGCDSNEDKESRIIGFINGDIKKLVSKPSITGFGMNLQHCANMAFVGLSHSYEAFYQAVRRCWRFGQTRPVNVHVVSSDIEQAILDNVKRKEIDAQRMAREMIAHTREITIASIKGTSRSVSVYRPTVNIRIPSWLKTEAA
jgi:superfamily II DNA or RNA helicase